MTEINEDILEVHTKNKMKSKGIIMEDDRGPNDLDKIILGEKNNLDLKVFTSGHRNPQGLTKINNSIFHLIDS